MKKHFLLLLALTLGLNYLIANPIDTEKAKHIGQKFVLANFDNEMKNCNLQLVYTGVSSRNEACFYVFNADQQGFVIVSADDRFRPIVGYSDEGPFATENPSPELMFYLDRIIEARTSRNAVLIDNTAEEWQSVAATGKLLSRNGGRGVDYICTTKWNQDSPYNLYAPEASSGPGGRCYAGCVATAMSQVMKRWNYPQKGTGSHSYYCYGYGSLSANFGQTTYQWDLMPDRLGGASQEEIEAVALFMYHCGVAVDMNFSPTGSGANSWDVPYAIRQYFSYSNQADLRDRDSYSLVNWQNQLKESFDLGWPVYYSGFSNSGGHAFVCDGYNDSDLFHFNWGWGGSSDGWFVIDEIDYAGWAQAVFNYVPSNVYDYMPLQPENFSVEPSNDFDYSATLTWTNPTQDIHFNTLTAIDQIVVTRNGEIIYTEDNVTPGANMTFTDYYMPTMVNYGVYAVCHNAIGVVNVEKNVLLGPTCNWTIEMTSSDAQGWNEGYLSFINSAGIEIAQVALETAEATHTFTLPFGRVDIRWKAPTTVVENMSFNIKDSTGKNQVSFTGSSNDLGNGLFFIANNTCNNLEENMAGPQNLSATLSGDDIQLSWEPIDAQAIHYQVYRDNTLYAIVNGTNFSDTQATDVFHSYFITAITENGETWPSNVCNLQPETSCEAPSNLRYEMTTPTKVKVMWDAPQDENLTGYMLYRRTKGEAFKRIKLLTNTYYTDNINSLSNSRFEYAVCAYYQANDCLSGYGSAQDSELNFVEVNKSIIPQHLDFLFHEGNLILHWQEATMADSYNVYRNGELIAQGLTYPSFIDEDIVPQQPYRYTVTGRTSTLESSPSNEVYVDWTTATSENIENQDIVLYPNPTEDKVFVEANGLRQVRVFNMMGQEIQNQTVETSRVTIDLSAQPQGCYFIEAITDQGCKTTKILKIK